DVGVGGRIEAELFVVGGGAIDMCREEVELFAHDLQGLAREVAEFVLDPVQGGQQVAVVRTEVGHQGPDTSLALSLQRPRRPLCLSGRQSRWFTSLHSIDARRSRCRRRASQPLLSAASPQPGPPPSPSPRGGRGGGSCGSNTSNRGPPDRSGSC